MKYLICSLLSMVLVSQALATEDRKTIPQVVEIDPGESLNKFYSESPFSLNLNSPIHSADLFNRTKYIVETYFGFAAEPSYQSDLDSLSGHQTLKGLNQVYKYFDPQRQFDRFSAFESQGPGVVHVYQDRDSRQAKDYSIPLGSEVAKVLPFANFHPTASQPLSGLRIALDPGHMGGKIWDERTGKFVTDHKGHTVSEGVINLQTCLLLKERLEKEGATVLVTHENIGPVTSETWNGLNLKNYIPSEVYESTLEPWFISLLQKAPPGKDLAAAFSKSQKIKKLFSEDMRYEFFVLKEDLNARAEMIKNFKADLTLVIHYDTSDPKNDPNGISKTRVQATKVYVAGGFEATEFGSRAERRDFAKHLFEPYWWNASVALARSLSLQLRTVLKLKGDKPYGEQVQVDEGVLARNLNLTRQVVGSALAYVECLYYNDPVEFASFLKADNPMTIGGVSYPYSNRLKQVVDALESGVLNFAANVNAF